MNPGSDHTSYSQVRRFEQCPKSFELHYRKKLPAASSDAATFGKVLHATCESLAREATELAEPTAITTERAKEAFERAWRASGLTGLALFQEGLEMSANFARDQGMLDGSRVIALEQRFLLPAGRFAVLGFMDRVDRLDDETIEIIDYKTNHQLFTKDELENDLQLPLYQAAAQQLWPWAKKVRLTFWMLRHRLRLPVVRTAEQVTAALRYVESTAEKAATATAFPATLGSHCGYCDHREQCDAYAEALKGTRRFVCQDQDNLDEVAREREEVAGLVRILDGRKKELEGLLKGRLKGESEIYAAGMRYRMVPTRSPAVYPLAPTVNALVEATDMAREDVFDRLAVVDVDALKALLDELGDKLPKRRLTVLRAELQARATRMVSPRFTASEHSAA